MKMGSVVSFSRPKAPDGDLAIVAERLIEELGDQAGYSVGLFARTPGLDDAARQRLLAIAAEIERLQGIGWRFADDPQAAECSQVSASEAGVGEVASNTTND